MKMRLLTAVLAALVVLAAVPVGTVAQSDDPAWADDLFTEMESMVGVYNDNVDSLDLPIGESLLQNARITAEISDDAGNVAYYSIETDGDKRITSLEREEHEDPTLRIVTTLDAMEEIATANDPVSELGAKIASGEVSLQGVTFTNAMLTTALDIVRSVVDLFGL